MELDREELVEQAYFFRALGDRAGGQTATQDLLVSLREEILSSTRLPLAIDFLLGELRQTGVLAPGMTRLGHYFRPFQAFVMQEAERESGRFDFLLAVDILAREAQYLATGPTPQGVFLFQFEAISRNRLGYDRGLEAMAADPTFDEDWSVWIRALRRQIGLVDVADLIYVHSLHYRGRQQKERARQVALGLEPEPEPQQRPALFGEKEGKIALASRRKDPLLMFAALERHLGYPTVPRPRRADDNVNLLPQLVRRMEVLERRIKLLEEESRGGIDLTKLYERPPLPGE